MRQACGGAGDGLGLAALFRLNAGIGAGRVDQRDDRHLEAVGELHDAHGLAVAVGHGHAKIVLEAGLGVGTLFLADHRDRRAAETGKTALDGLVLGKFAVAGERREIGEEACDEVEAMRPVGMAGDLRLLPGGEFLVEVFQSVRRALFQPLDLVGDIDGAASLLKPLQFEDLAFKVGDRLFKIEIIVHGPLVLCRNRSSTGRADAAPAPIYGARFENSI